MKSLLPVSLLALLVCVPVAGAPVVTFDGTTANVTIPPGHTVVYAVVAGTDRVHSVTDTDGNGVISIPNLGGYKTVFADVETGEWVYGPTSARETPLPANSIVRGTNGAFSRIILPNLRAPAALWVRPGVGAWGVSYAWDGDYNENNRVLFFDSAQMAPLGSSPATPSGFLPGDRLLTLAWWDLDYAGVVDPVVNAPQGPGVLSFAWNLGNVYEGEAQGTTIFLMRTGGTEGTVSVLCDTAGSTAQPGVDYVPFDPLVTFGPGEVLKSIRINSIDDGLFTAIPRELKLSLTNPQGAPLGTYNSFAVPFSDNDPRPVVSVETTTDAVEEKNAPWIYSLPIRLAGAFRDPLTLQTKVGGVTGTLVFQPGETQKDLPVPIAGNTVPERDRSVKVELSGLVENWLTWYVLIKDDDFSVLSSADATVSEGSDSVKLTFTLDQPPAESAFFSWSTADGTATAGADYNAASGTLGFNGTSGELTVYLRHDSEVEGSETFYLDLTNLVRLTTSRMRIMVTIHDNDAPVTSVIMDPLTVQEGNSGNKLVEMRVRLSAAMTSAVDLVIEAVPGTATPGDYVYSTQNRSFAPGEVEKVVTVQINGDPVDELDESFSLVARQNGIERGRGLITILDEDTTAFTGLTDTSVEEKTGVTVDAVFRVTLTPPPPAEARIDYATSDVTAVAGSDYVARSGTLVFAPGQGVAEVRVEIIGDTTIEPAETFALILSNAVGAYLHGDRGVATIFDDDSPAPPVAITNASVLEGNSGTVQVPLKLLLARALAHSVTLTVATNGTGTATSADYQPLTQSVTIPAGHTELTVHATVIADSFPEGNETFGVEVREGSDVRATATVTIIDDDTASLVTVADTVVQESASQAVLRVTISPPPITLASVEFTTADGTARAGSDYTAFAGTILFFPGQTHTDLAVNVLGDSEDESNETFTLRLSGAVGATLQDDRATATIVDDDATAPSSTFSLQGATVTEKTGSSVFALFPVTLSPASSSTASVVYATQDGTATAGADYLASNGTLVFTPGQTQREVRVEVFGDAITEPSETLRLRLSDPVGAELAASTATATIHDDDVVVVTPTVSVADIEVREGDHDEDATFTITLSKALTTEVRVRYATAEHSALPRSDYDEKSGLVTFAPGQLAQTVKVLIRGDRVPEASELFRLELQSSEGAPISDGNAICTIVDDDTAGKRRTVRH